MKQKVHQPQSVTWNQFKGEGYCAFASLKRQICIGVLSIATLSVAAQAASPAIGKQATQAPTTEETEEKTIDEVTVTGTMAPLTQLQSARIVGVLTRSDIERAGVQSINDLFKLATGVDVRQRGGFGIQTDISIDGGIFDQITLLLNGVNINNPQTGHLAADFPVSISDIERIEILEGAASRVYGGQSFGGAINIVTRRGKQSNVSAGFEGGMHTTFQGDARLELVTGRWANRISGGGGGSNGGTENSQWKKGQLYYQGDWTGKDVDLNWQFGFSKKEYGANTFYSAAYPNQYERNERYILSVGAETKGRIHFTPHVYWQRSWDNFELIHGTTTGENFHRTDVYGIHMGGYTNWWGGRTAFGADLRQEGILSTNLGNDLAPDQYVGIHGEDTVYTRRDNRTTFTYNLEHNILLPHWTISLGVMGATTTSIDHRHRFYPGADISYRPGKGWKIFASYNRGYRLPSFTELYYKSPTHQGNTGLKPEQNNSFQLGARYEWQGIEGTVRAFYHRGEGIIDWVMYSATDSYHSTSFNLDNLGVQANARVNFPTLMKSNTWVQQLDLGYTYIHQTRHDDQQIFKSNYALEYLRHKFVANLHHRIYDKLSATWSVRYQDRNGQYIKDGQPVSYSPYATLDVKLQWTAPNYQVYVQGTNVTNTHYYDLGNVPQPGIWVMAGARVKFNL